MNAKANTTQEKAAITGGVLGGGASRDVLALAVSASIQLEKRADLRTSCPEHLTPVRIGRPAGLRFPVLFAWLGAKGLASLVSAHLCLGVRPLHSGFQQFGGR